MLQRRMMLQRILTGLAFLILSFNAASNEQMLPVKVFILAGQSNMVGNGIVTPSQSQLDKNNGKGTLQYLVTNPLTKNAFDHLITPQGNWVVRDDVWLADLTSSDALTVKTNKIGPELQFGHYLGDTFKNQILIIKTAWGGKSLQKDFRPPNSSGKTGPYYTLMVEKIHSVLNNIQNHVPGYNNQGYELAGFGWHQGWNDRINQAANDEYQLNCVNLINDLRAEFGDEDLPFIIATTGMSGWNEAHPRALSLMEAQLAVPYDSNLANPSNVQTIDTRDFYRSSDESPTSQSYHWNSNAETYYLIGNALASALVDTHCLPNENNSGVCSDTLFEAEDNTLFDNARFANDHQGYTGLGFIDFGGTGSYVEWPSINIDTGGYYQVSFRYANLIGTRDSRLLLNGDAILDLPFSGTGSWTAWDTVTYEVFLPQGSHTFRVQAINAGPNLDSMSIVPHHNLYEAEQSNLLNNAWVTDVHDGFTGSGFVDFGGAGSYIQWTAININNDGNYKISFRYANLRGTRDSKLILNGEEILSLPFSATGSWKKWETVSYDVFLSKGIHTMRVEAVNQGPNLDSMLIQSNINEVTFDKLYLAQNHVLEPHDFLLTLVSDRQALLKVQLVTEENNLSSPEVSATLFLNGESTRLLMQGPSIVPNKFESSLGAVEHKYEDSFTATIPKDWVQPGLRLTVNAGNNWYDLNDIKITAPNKIEMHMFDIHYFSHSTGDYPADWLSELESKWPVSALKLNRINDLIFKELVIPPRAGVGAAKVKSKQDYKDQTGLSFDGEQAAALQWVNALQDAAGTSKRLSLYYVNIHGVHAGGQAGGFKGVGNGKSIGVLHHELGHAMSLPHWGNSQAYPYKGDMHGIKTRNPEETHAGPTWAFDSRNGNFIPPTVQDNSVGGVLGTYKLDPMQGGGQGDQEQGYAMRHFSDYSVNQMRNYLVGHMVKWNDDLNRFAKWNQYTNDYSSIFENDGVQFPIEKNVDVYSVMISSSAVKPDISMIYPPIGPYKTGLIKLFDPRVADDRNRAKSIFCPANGCDLSVKINQGGVEKYAMLPIAWDPSQDPLSSRSIYTKAINLPALDGEIREVILLLTPNTNTDGMGSNPFVLARWSIN